MSAHRLLFGLAGIGLVLWYGFGGNLDGHGYNLWLVGVALICLGFIGPAGGGGRRA